ncbi:esterase-like activity of phytase family protein [Streptomonospora litoralis]|uniref:Phytase-like domain-containing protein n=1 Tax=Streptomonospora litoralis TaxID=2498135 RepID=A0A4P6Q2X8_9ACTN|nr:esterase-like activity of phytase family protein [Streptomonospora litoralis]QBI53154.1 hypothetical protein EKD16_06785 [Streptomonospora litoralis]
MRSAAALGTAASLLLAGLSAPALSHADTAGSATARLLGVHVLEHGLDYRGTTVGGLSGIDYDPDSGEYVLISDDRSEHGPARYYSAEIGLSGGGIGGVALTGATALRRFDRTPFPALEDWHPPRWCAHAGGYCDLRGPVDPEAVRFDPRGHRVWWSTEGERSVGDTRTVLLDPLVRATDDAGRFRGHLRTPSNLRMDDGDTGPRRNLTAEGFAFADHGRLIVTAMEGPLLQDGDLPTPESGTLTRVTVQNRGGWVRDQYAYPLEPVPAEPEPAGGYYDNGVTDILALDAGRADRYLVLERSYVEGVGNTVRIFTADTGGATDVSRTESLADAEDVTPMSKRLLVDLGETGLDHVDNVEGMTWGPDLPSGERTLLLVSDDNFSDSQVTQIVALAV